MCVGGRLHKALLPEETCRRFIADPKSEVRNIIILHHHLQLRCADVEQSQRVLMDPSRRWCGRQGLTRKLNVPMELYHTLVGSGRG